MIKCLIFDLDDTLIDTSPIANLRDQRQWRDIDASLNLCKPYEQVVDILNTARAAGLKVCVVTNSPANYAKKVLEYFNISIDYLVAYYDVQNPKPSPDGILLTLNHYQINPVEAVYLGDSEPDLLAAKSANVEFFAVDWASLASVPESNFGVQRLLSFIGVRNSTARIQPLRSPLLQNENHFYLGYYLTGGIRSETLSFKNSIQEAVDRWVGKAEEQSVTLPHIDYVIRALGHAETNVDVSDVNTALDYLASSLADCLQADYVPTLLIKNRVLTKSVKLSSKDRKKQVEGAYNVDTNKHQIKDGSTFLIVDDVYTSGATTNEIIRSLTYSYPKTKVYVFTLVKTLFREQVNGGTEEAQHNAQLFSDLYAHDNIVLDKAQNLGRPKRFNLTDKKYSAGYANTNNNFVIQNLKSVSIASEPSLKPILQVIYVLKNMLQRGLPTNASRYLREQLGAPRGEASLALISSNSLNWQRLIRGDVKSGYNPAKYFFDEILPKYLGEYQFIKQLTLPEVQIFDMTQVYVDQYHNRQVDFYIPHVGLIIEIDGTQHQSSLDDAPRDEFTQSLGLKTIRFTTQEVSTENQSFLQKFDLLLEHIENVQRLEMEGVLSTPNGLTLQHYLQAYDEGVDLDAPEIKLTAAVRFQLLLLELIENGDIRFNEAKTISLINRDGIEFSQVALTDLRNLLDELLTLTGNNDKSLLVSIEEVSEANAVDDAIVVDFSILERYDDRYQNKLDTIFVRTHYLDFYRQYIDGHVNSPEVPSLVGYDFFEISCSDPIKYDLDLSPESRQRESLRFFLSNLFLPSLEDVDFREGQVGIIGSALNRKGTLGLLPTGSGKSICYQLSSILQPAISFVVCPIKSLMYDQKADLDSIGFTRSNYITSDLKPAEKQQIQNDFGRGKYFFVFISPERFQTHAFRAEMAAIGLDKTFAYAVIDEVHCLSEWGHDFRTSYLNLANAIQRFAPQANYIGLTATASVNVLKDIQAEFNIAQENIRTPLNFTREELIFHVIDDQGGKLDSVKRLAFDMEEKWNSKGKDKAGIIFTSTVNGSKGCYELAGNLSTSLAMDVRFYSGSAPTKGKYSVDGFDEYKRQVQNDFKTNKYSLLTATKAFGMGVNKGNVAYTVHFGIPGSMESLYQEAGRAGRDKTLFIDKPADCYVLLTKENNTKALDKIWDSSSTVTDLKESTKQLSRGSDINTNLFLMTNSLDTINDEFKLIEEIYNYLMSVIDGLSVVVEARQFKTDKAKFEKAVYRLCQLGVVADWVIEDFYKGRLEIQFTRISEDQLKKNLENTVNKYEPGFVLDSVFSNESEFYRVICDRYKKGKVNQIQFIFIVLLIWSYDHFAYNRRQSLKTVYEQCGDLADGIISEQEFKNRLEGYFKFNESSHLLHHLAENASDPSIWLSVFYKEGPDGNLGDLLGSEDIVILKNQLSRFLESYKDNVCMNYLSGIIRLVNDQFDDADGERRMARSLDSIKDYPIVSIEQLIRDTARLKRYVSVDSQCRYTRLMYEKFPQPQILELLNQSFEDPYTYRKLIEPLNARLNSVTQQYRGIEW